MSLECIAYDDPYKAFWLLCRQLALITSLKPEFDVETDFGTRLTTKHCGDLARVAFLEAVEKKIAGNGVIEPIDVTLYTEYLYADYITDELTDEVRQVGFEMNLDPPALAG